MLKPFLAFLAKMKANFGRISRSTRYEMEVGDLENDAYVLALEIGDRRGRPVDFSDPADQDLVMRAVNLQNVRRGDWKMRRAVRIDQEPENEAESGKWVERLPAPASSDPLVSLLIREAAPDQDALLAASYSQASAYVVTFNRFNNDRQKVCTYLVVSSGTLARRVLVAADSVRVQPSMFDRIERIPPDFIPMTGRQYGTKIEDRRETGQREWNFDSAR